MQVPEYLKPSTLLFKNSPSHILSYFEDFIYINNGTVAATYTLRGTKFIKNSTKLQEKLCQIVYNKFHDANCSHGYEVPIWISFHIRSADKFRHDQPGTRGESPTLDLASRACVLLRCDKAGCGALVKLNPQRVTTDHTAAFSPLACPGCGKAFAREATIGGSSHRRQARSSARSSSRVASPRAE